MTAKILNQKFYDTSVYFASFAALAANTSSDTSYEATIYITNKQNAPFALDLYYKDGGVSANEMIQPVAFNPNDKIRTLDFAIGEEIQLTGILLPPNTGLYAQLTNSISVTAVGKEV